jgi:hypothetical protein
MIVLDDLAKLDRLGTIIIEASATDPEQRQRAFGLLGERIKRDGITRLPNGRWEAIVRFGLHDELKAYARTRRDAESAIDRLMAMLADPAQAISVYRYFRSLAARGEADGLAVAGDLVTPDGAVQNCDAKSEVAQ